LILYFFALSHHLLTSQKVWQKLAQSACDR